MPDWLEVLEVIWKGLAGGLISYGARKIFEGSQKDLEKLQKRSSESTNLDKEELLAHYVEKLTEEIGDINDLTVKESVEIIRSRAGVFAAYLHLKVQRLSTEGERPKGV